jgi:hypothetical protein
MDNQSTSYFLVTIHRKGFFAPFGIGLCAQNECKESDF